MKIKNILFGTVGAASMVGGAINAHAIAYTGSTEGYGSTAVQPQIRLNLDKDTDTVHFIRDNTDPYVVTKVYRLKNADPYEVRPYLRDIFTANKVTDDLTRVECIKYNDGTGFVVISAEEDRFGPQPEGMGIDELIKSLDKEKLTSASGSDRFLYFPQYRSASELETMIKNVGMDRKYSGTSSNDDPAWQLVKGRDKIDVDPELNALFFFIPKYSKKNIANMLKYYDQPVLQVAVKYTVYEVYAENDGKIGADFQSWKNNDGMDLLSVGGRYRSNWTATLAGGIDPGTGDNNTQYFSLNPKWNSRYLDLLTSIGKAKVMTTGEVVVKNNETAQIYKTSEIFKSTKDPNTSTTTLTTAYQVTPSSTKTAIAYDGETKIYVDALKKVSAVQFSVGSVKRYQLSVEGANFIKDGKNMGRQTVADSLNTSAGWAAYSGNDYADITVDKGPTITTDASTGYSFKMTVTPYVGRDCTTLTVYVKNNSLTGWNSDGSPRISNNVINTKVMLSNKSNRFAIGGVTKTAVVRSVSGIPFLRQIPILGWIFGTESESTKKSQFIVVAECATKAIDAPLTEAATGTMSDVTNATKDAGEGFNKWGFDQYLIDKPIK